MTDSDDLTIEAMLLRWSDSPGGKTVTLLLEDDGTGENPFKGLPTGRTNGQRLALAVVLINEAEEQKPLEPKPNGSTKPRSYAQRAGILSNDPVFSTFLKEQFPTTYRAIATPRPDWSGAHIAAEIIRRISHVGSRRDLIEGTEAGNRFRDLEAEFSAWKQVG
jgi:hypothetical protein